MVFLGAGALVVAGGLWLGLIDGLIPAFTTWFVTSLVLIIALRGVIQKYAGGDEQWHNTDEDAEAMETVVTVTETIRPGEDGRIMYRGPLGPPDATTGRSRRAARPNWCFARTPLGWWNPRQATLSMVRHRPLPR